MRTMLTLTAAPLTALLIALPMQARAEGTFDRVPMERPLPSDLAQLDLRVPAKRTSPEVAELRSSGALTRREKTALIVVGATAATVAAVVVYVFMELKSTPSTPGWFKLG
jgi:hypothetical protein